MLGFIYQIISPKTDKVYVGSTFIDIKKRLQGHESHYKSWKIGNHNYITAFDILETGDYFVQLLDYKHVNCRDELQKLEGYWIRNTNCVNKAIAGRDYKEYYNDNKNLMISRMKIYSEKNKEHLVEYKHEYYISNKEELLKKVTCECGGVYTKVHKLRHERSNRHQKMLNVLSQECY